MRLPPIAWLLTLALLLPIAAGGGHSAALALVASAMLCGLAAHLVLACAPRTCEVHVKTPASRRLHGRFLQQCRPGVPGRTRSRAPGCGL